MPSSNRSAAVAGSTEGGAAAFWDSALAIVADVRAKSWREIMLAAAWVAESLASGHRVLAFGTGHSHALAEEFYARAGGLAEVEALLEPSLMLHEGPLKSSAFERVAGLGRVIWAQRARGAGVGDTLFVFSNSGRNPVPVELASAARADGVRVVAVTSLRHSRATPAVGDGPRLFEVADLVIDNGGPVGDAVVRMGDVENSVGATSTITGAFIVEAIVCEAVSRLTAMGRTPRVLRSYNVEEA